MGDFKIIKEVKTGMEPLRIFIPDGEIPLLTGQSCFLAACPCRDTIVHLGPQVMASKDLDKEMAEGTPFGLKLREIAKKVEALK